MKRVITLLCLLSLAGTAAAQFSIGFNTVKMPTYVDPDDFYVATEDMYMLRIGSMLSPEFRIEGYVGYMKETFETDPPLVPAVEQEGSGMGFGAGGYYVIEAPANTSFSFGARFLYASVNVEESASAWELETTAWAIDPLMRIDFAIPGAERLAFFTEFGFRYANATSTETIAGVQNTIDYKWSGFQTYAPENVLAGAYYVF
jgi:hypothetical protein